MTELLCQKCILFLQSIKSSNVTYIVLLGVQVMEDVPFPPK